MSYRPSPSSKAYVILAYLESLGGQEADTTQIAAETGTQGNDIRKNVDACLAHDLIRMRYVKGGQGYPGGRKIMWRATNFSGAEPPEEDDRHMVVVPAERAAPLRPAGPRCVWEYRP